MKIILSLIFTSLTYAQIGLVSVLPEDMLLANCRPEEKILATKRDYSDELLKLGFDARNLLRFPLISKEQMHDILTAVRYFPNWMNIGNNSDWKRIKVIFRPNMDIVANAYITLGKKWLDFDPLHRQAIIIHEISHRIATRFNNYAYSKYWENIQDSWLKARFIPRVGWRATANPEQNFVSEYAASNPSEDWAESLTSYRINPELLYEVSEVKYHFIRENIYLGVEYLDSIACHDTPIISDKTNELISFLDENYKTFKKSILKNDTFKDVLLKTVKQAESHIDGQYKKSNYEFKLYVESMDDFSALSETRAFKKHRRRTK